MKIPWPLYLSWKQLFPTGRGISFFSVLGILGVALGVNVMIVVIAFMKGFQDKFRQDIQGTISHRIRTGLHTGQQVGYGSQQ